MFGHLRTAAACAAVAGLALTSAAMAGPTGLGGRVDGGTYHIYRTPEMWAKAGHQPNLGTSGSMLYYGGTVFSGVKVVSVIWGSNVSSQTVNGMPGFLSAIVNSTFVDQMGEYSTKHVHTVDGHSSSRQTIGRGTYINQVQITPKHNGTSITDKQVQAELAYQISIGTLPPQDPETLYMIYFPSNVTITLDGLTSCVSFGAYHFASDTKGGTKKGSNNIFYGVMPDCGYSFNSHTIISAHEYAEATTDNRPTPGSSPTFPQAWNTSDGYEIGDLCEGTQGQLTTSSTTYYVQQVYLNSTANCSTGNYTSP